MEKKCVLDPQRFPFELWIFIISDGANKPEFQVPCFLKENNINFIYVLQGLSQIMHRPL